MKNTRFPTISASILFSPSYPSPSYPFPTQQMPSTIISTSLQQYIESETPSHGQKIHAHLLKVFDEMPYPPPIIAYNQIILGHLKAGQVEQSLVIFRRFAASHRKPNEITFSMILKASTECTSVLLLESCILIIKQIHAQILKSGVELDDALCTTLVNSYVHCNMIGYARRAFDEFLGRNVIFSAAAMITGYMNQGAIQSAEEIFLKCFTKDVVAFNAMIDGYSKSVETAHSSLHLFIEMQRSNLRPTMLTFFGVIKACSLLAAFETGQQVQAFLLKANFYNNTNLGSAVIDMYSKCGEIKEARRFFNEMVEKTVVSWSFMIDGYGKNGHPFEALNLFNQMQMEFIKPTHFSFIAVLSACAHGGLVAEGEEIFQRMEGVYYLKPKTEHYTCMVNLLGRAGRLDMAWKFVRRMCEKPHPNIWLALLSSCWMHGDVKMAKMAAAEFFKCGGEDRHSPYVSLSNALANAGHWENVSAVREIMKGRRISKEDAHSILV